MRIRRTPRELCPKFLPRMWATFFWTGCVPIAPGTAGSALALGIALLWPAAWWPVAPPLFALAATLGCVAIARSFPPKDEGGDPRWFVLDEAAGMWLALWLSAKPDFMVAGIAFLFFRLFDNFKPFPIRRLERLGGGWGIVADDLGAGLYALALTALVAAALNSN